MKRAILVIVLLLVASATSAGPITGYGSRAAFGGNDFLDWQALFPNAPYYGLVGDPFTLASAGGVNVTTTMLPNPGYVLFGAFVYSTIAFPAGEAALFTEFRSGPLTMTFDSLIVGAGFQITTNSPGNLVATVEAFGPGHSSLGTFSVSGLGGGCGAVAYPCDGHSPFIGVKSTGADIESIVVTTTNDADGFMISGVALDTQAPAVPEPSSLLLLGTGLVGAVRARRHFFSAPLP